MKTHGEERTRNFVCGKRKWKKSLRQTILTGVGPKLNQLCTTEYKKRIRREDTKKGQRRGSSFDIRNSDIYS